MLVYGRLAGYDFIEYDDQVHTFANPHLNPLKWSGVVYLWQHPYEQLYIPLSYTLFALLCWISRTPSPERFTVTGSPFNPHFFHFASIAFQTSNTLLVYYLLRRIVRNDIGALAGALLFGIHPLQVESVGWISELRGQLSALLGFLSLTGYIRAWDRIDEADKIPGRRQQWGALPLFIGAFLCFVLAILAKPTAVIYPLLFPLIDSLIHHRRWVWYVRDFLPWFVVSAIFIIVTHNDQFIMRSAKCAVYLRPFIAGNALTFYIEKFLAPVNLAIDYGLTPRIILSDVRSFELWTIPVALLVVVFALRKKWPWLVTSSLISLVCLSTNIGLTPFSFQYYSTVADRYAYLALIGPAIVFAKIVARIRAPILFVLPAVIIGIWSGLSCIRCAAWKDTITIMKEELAVNPLSALALVDVGNYYQDRGDHPFALREYRLTQQQRPDLWRGYYNAATSLMAMGRVREAMSMYMMTIDYNNGYADAHTNMAKALVESGRPEAALPEFDTVVRLDSTAGEVHLGRGQAYMELREYAKALTEFSSEIDGNESSAEAYVDKGLVQRQLGQTSAAAASLSKGDSLEDSDAARYSDLGKGEMLLGQYDKAHSDLAKSLSLAPNQGHTRFLLNRVVDAQYRLQHGLPPTEY